MLVTMTAPSMGMIPPLHNVRTALSDEGSEERRRHRRLSCHDRGRPELRRPRPVRCGQVLN
jgi:hypothetical protein